MIFTGEHYYLGLIQAALAVFYVLFGVFVAGRSRVFDRVGAWLIGAYLLMYKFNEYGPFRAVPRCPIFSSAWRRSSPSVR